MIRIKKDEIEMEGTGEEILVEFGCIAGQVRDSLVKNGVASKVATDGMRHVFDKAIMLSEQRDKTEHEEKVHVIHVRSVDEAMEIISKFLGGKR